MKEARSQPFNNPRTGTSRSSASISIEVGGDVTGTIVAGDNNYIYTVHRHYGDVINYHTAPSVKPRDMRPKPPPTSRLIVGREYELTRLESHIQSREPVLVHGENGLGKSALIKQAANSEAAEAMPDGVLFADGNTDAEFSLGLQDVVQKLFDALFESNPPQKIDYLTARTYLSNTIPLLILDHLNLSMSALGSLLDLFPQGSLLVTSPGIEYSDAFEALEVAPLARADSMQLLSSRCGVDNNQANAARLDAICDLLGDVPLAIVMTAKFVLHKKIALDVIAERLSTLHPPSPSRIRAAIERSYGLIFMSLNGEERQMLARAAAAPGITVDRDWLEDVAGGRATSRSLESLELLQANSPRLRLAEGLKQFTLSSKQNTEELQLSFQAYLLGRLKYDPLDVELLKRELGNILGLMRWAVDEKRWSDVITLGRTVDPYLTLHGLWDGWKTVLDQVLSAARFLTDQASEGWALHQLGSREIGLGNTDQARKYLIRALRIRESLQDEVGAAYTRHNLRFVLPPPQPPPPPDPPSKWIIPGILLLMAVLIAVFSRPSLRLKVQAVQGTYSVVGQVVDYTYVIDNGGLIRLSGPVLVTDDRAKVTCPDLRTLGNENGFLDWDESFICSGSYVITPADIENRSVVNHAVASAADNGIRSRGESLTIRFDPSYLALTKRADRTTYSAAGETVTFSYTVRNAGAAPLHSPVIVEDDRTEITCPDVNTTGNEDSILNPGETITCVALYRITDADVENGFVTNTAGARAEETVSEPRSFTMQLERSLIPQEVTLIKSADKETYENVGEQITFSYIITNHGQQPLEGPVTVTDDRASVVCPAIDAIGNQNGYLDSGETMTCVAIQTITRADLDDGSVTNTAWAGGDGWRSEPKSATIYKMPARPPSRLTLTTSAQPKSYERVGQEITFTYLVTNEGTQILNGPVIIGGDASAGSCPQLDTVGNLNDTLDPNEVITCAGEHLISQADVERGYLTNTVWASAGLLTSNPASITIHQSALALKVFASPEIYGRDGEEITYTYTVESRSKWPLKDPLVVTDDKTLVTCPGFESIGNQDGYLDWNETVMCTGTYITEQADIDRGSVTNTAQARAGTVNSDPVILMITGPEPDPALELTTTPNPVRFDSVGQTIVYEYLILNAGNVTLSTPFTVVDDHANNGQAFDCGPPDGALPPAERLTCTASYRITQADFGPKLVTNNSTASIRYREESITSSAVTTITCVYPPSRWVPYIVLAGDTLSEIQRWYSDADVEDLQRANCMGSSALIYRGQTLYVPRTPPLAGVSGFVQDSEGQRLSGITLVLIRNGVIFRQTTTSENGAYSFSNLEPGSYRIFQMEFSLRWGENVSQDFVIIPVTP